MSYKEKFIEIYNENIKRAGSKELFDYISNKTDFFTAPASTKFHLNYEGGLVEHCVNVCELLFERFPEEKKESLAICGLLHDLCKANYYKVAYRNQKNAEGKWESVPYYTVEEKFPFGHGEKSVFLIERYMKLEIEEAVAIRWHMGGFDASTMGGDRSEGRAYEMYPLAVKLALCDMESSYLREKRNLQ